MSLSPNSIEYIKAALQKSTPVFMIKNSLKSLRESEADIDAFFAPLDAPAAPAVEQPVEPETTITPEVPAPAVDVPPTWRDRG